MRVDVVEEAGFVRATPVGRLDIAGAQEADLAFSVLAGSAPALLVDLSQVDFIASMGVRTLMLTAKTLLRRNGKMAVFGARETVDYVLRATGFDEIVPLCPDEESALAALPSGA